MFQGKEKNKIFNIKLKKYMTVLVPVTARARDNRELR